MLAIAPLAPWHTHEIMAHDEFTPCESHYESPLEASRPAPPHFNVRHFNVEVDARWYRCTMIAPGFAPGDLEIKCESGRLFVSGETKLKGGRKQSINCSIHLPADADVGEGAQAEIVDGVISVRVPKKVASPPRRISIRAGPEGCPPTAGRLRKSQARAADVDSIEACVPSSPYKIIAVAAGVSAQDMEISADQDRIRVHGATRRTGASFDRAYILPKDADVAAARAVHADGILTLTIPKKPVREAKRIQVNAVPLSS